MGFYSIKIHINSNNQNLFNVIKNTLPLSEDSIIAPGGYNIQEGTLSPFDYNFFMADIQFNRKIDRDMVLQNIKELDGIIHDCLSGSQVISYIQKHKEKLPGEIETILEKN